MTSQQYDPHEHVPDSINGSPRSPLVIDQDDDLRRAHNGSICVHGDATLTIYGTVNGSLHLRPRGRVVIVGSHNGSLHLQPGAEVIVNGRQAGSSHVSVNAHLQVGERGRLAGSLHNSGVVDNYGERGGNVHGSGQINDHPGSHIQQPVERNGVSHYEWRN